MGEAIGGAKVPEAGPGNGAVAQDMGDGAERGILLVEVPLMEHKTVSLLKWVVVLLIKAAGALAEQV